jgi:adenylate cyclase
MIACNDRQMALVLTYLDDQRRSWSADPEVSIDRALTLARQAISINDTVPQAYFTLGFIYLYAKAQHDNAIAAAEKAIELDPNYADGYTLLSSAYFFSGYPEKSLPLDRKAKQLNPTASYLYYMHLGRSHYVQQRYKEAVEALQQAVELNINYIPNHLWLAATYAEMGIIDEAVWELEQVFTLNPGFSADDWIESRPYKDPLYKKRLYDSLLKAGINSLSLSRLNRQ